ncbi:MAG: EAL domain-containing protein [Proteobacteria bacterium]|nr:EAL domain-containing protein [Pseudomonadota bacterium]
MHQHAEKKLLVIDDDPAILSSISGYFEDYGYEVSTADNGRVGLEVFRIEKPEVVLVDIRMPDINGLEVLAVIAKESPGTPIIMVSSTNAIQDAIEALRLDAWDFVTKPIYDMVVLEHAVVKALERAELMRENRHNRKRLERQTVELEELNRNLERRVKEQTEELAQSLIVDELTGLYNKAKLDEVLRTVDIPILLLINLNNFVQINTFYGFEIGDEVLRQVGEFLKRQKDEKSDLFRLTSVEFVLALRDMSLERAGKFAHEIHKNLFNHSVVLKNDISIHGIPTTMVVVEGQGADLLKQAHIGMMEAKRIGKNRVLVLDKDSSLEERYEANMYWMNRVRTALKNDTIVPYFQPIINNATGEIEKFECLSRMVENDEVISPFKFIEAAKKVGVIHQLTQVIIEKSIVVFSGTSYEFSINITEDDLKEGTLVKYMTQCLASSSIRPEQVVFEVLEGISVTEADEILEQLTALKSMGCKIAIDDFGAEQSNFSRLLELNADYIKIDGKFIKNIHTDVKSYTITKAISRLARDIGTKVIAEFVHCQEVQDKMIDLGIDYSQGYHLGAPTDHI